MCVPAVRADMLKIQGVDPVAFSSDLKKVDVHFEPDNGITVKQIRRFLKDQGFFTRGADVRLRGEVIRQDGKPALRVTRTGVVYLLQDHPDAKGTVSELDKSAEEGAAVTATGSIPWEWGKDTPRLLLRTFTLERRE